MRPLAIRIGIFTLAAFTTLASSGESDLPRPGRYTGTVDSEGVISFVISRDLKRVGQIRCRFRVTDTQYQSTSTLPETFTVSFSTRAKDFGLGVSPRYAFNVFGKDRKTDTEYFVYGVWRRRGLVKGHVQYQKWFQSTQINLVTGQVEPVRIPRGFDGLHHFTASVRRSR